MIGPVDVPIQASKEFCGGVVLTIVIKRTGIITIFLLKEICYGKGFRSADTGDHTVFICYSVFRNPPLDYAGRPADLLSIDKEEKFVLDDRSTEGKTISGGTFFLSFKINSVNTATMHVLILMINIGRSLNGVGT